ncbi:GNAT family N-acetyltransferase [Rufibacter latericius]|uniref:N-acetyltransferase n=1 Tax=Rufibacter latericius TaxID=2487040 RepID=A0A3M9MFX8_9BACT|nr:GNAT family N-acetyltransferase [Rufibacter latericius]RNI24095.1 N-acetyltransferase [Rufibacter latericius]
MPIAPLLPSHWVDVKRIYLEGIATGQATFQTEAPSWEDWDKGHLNSCRFVALEGEEVCGWVALSPVSSRCVYAGVAEVSVYVGQGFRGKGIGEKLLKHLITEAENNGIWTIQAGIFPENVASVKLHEKNGFRIVGLRERLAKHHGVWRSVYFLERRSLVAGND